MKKRIEKREREQEGNMARQGNWCGCEKTRKNADVRHDMVARCNNAMQLHFGFTSHSMRERTHIIGQREV